MRVLSRPFGVLVGAALLGASAPSHAHALKVVMRAEKPQEQAMAADIVIVGKVVSVEPDAVISTHYKGSTAKSAYRVANVKVQENLYGPKGVTHLRVGFIPTNQAPIKGDRDEIEYRGEVNHNLLEGHEACFFLIRHHEADFYIQRHMGQSLDKGRLSYEAEMKQIRRMTDALREPMTALKAKDLADRQFAAYTLLRKYRTQPTQYEKEKTREEAIPLAESKLILEALATLDWEKTDANGASASNAFWLLELKQAHGWNDSWLQQNGNNVKAQAAAFSAWVKEYADKHRINRKLTDIPKN